MTGHVGHPAIVAGRRHSEPADGPLSADLIGVEQVHAERLALGRCHRQPAKASSSVSRKAPCHSPTSPGAMCWTDRFDARTAEKVARAGPSFPSGSR